MEIKDLYNGTKLGIKNNELFEVLYNFSVYMLDNNEGYFYLWDDLMEWCDNTHNRDIIEAYLSAGQAIHGVNSFGGGNIEALNDISNEIKRIIALLAVERGWKEFVYSDGSVAYIDPNIEEDEED